MIGLRAFLRSFFEKEAPCSFFWIENKEGECVGPLVLFTNAANSDSMRYWAEVRMAKLVGKGLRANAIEYIGSEPMGGGNDITTIQPRWI